jgi:simple sugar transport system permease protein
LGIGVLVQVFNIQPFIASLAAMFLARGLANAVSVESLPINDEGFAAIAAWAIKFGEKRDIWRINAPMIVAFIIVILGFLLLHYTRFGRTVYGIGQGDDGSAINLMGLNAGRTTIMVYVISGILAALAGLVLASKLQNGQATAAMSYELNAIAAVAMGGTSMSGGRGGLPQTVVGLIVIGVITNALSLSGVSSYWQTVAMGVIILVAVIVDRVRKA